MEITKSNYTQALPTLFLIFLFQTLFLSYIDEGNYSFNFLATADGWLALVMWTSVFTLIGFTLFSIFNKKESLSFLTKILLAAVLAAPTALTMWYVLYLTLKTSS